MAYCIYVFILLSPFTQWIGVIFFHVFAENKKELDELSARFVLLFCISGDVRTTTMNDMLVKSCLLSRFSAKENLYVIFI